jgi:NTE family protein
LNERDRLADWLNAEVFADGTVASLWRPGRPRVWINATDLHAGVPFAFVPVYFDALCSDLARVRIADAVAASMSVPVVFRPVVVASYGDGCKVPLPAWVAQTARDRGASELMRTTARAFESYRDPARVRFLHLVDGGVTDNFGLSALIMMRRAATTPFAPFSARDAVRVRRMTFLVVNAEQTKAESWAMTQDGPNGMETLSAAMDGAINTGKRRSYDAFRDTVAAWERDVRAYRCALPKAKAAEFARGIKNWDCRDVHFAVDMISFADLDSNQAKRLASVETHVSLPAGVIDDLVTGGKQAVKDNAVVRKLMR